MVIAVLAAKGDYEVHQNILARLNLESFPLESTEDLNRPFDGLILPGGDCIRQGKQMKAAALTEPLRRLILGGMPVMGTCSGMALLARQLENCKQPYFLGTMPITVKLRHFESFQTTGAFGGISNVPMRFINAPIITDQDDEVEILTLTRGEVTAARYKNQLVTSFHPELTTDTTIHYYFSMMVEFGAKNRGNQGK